MKLRTRAMVYVVGLLGITPALGRAQSDFHAEISFAASLNSTPLDGRVYLLISKNNTREPRFQVAESGVNSQQVFGLDVEGLRPGQAAVIDGTAVGYPVEHLKQIPAGDYFVQALLSKYTTFHRADGFTVKMPMDEGEGQHFNTKPGNFYSEVKKVRIDPAAGRALRISLTKVVPAIPPPKDTKYVKHIRIQSELLTKFWGLPMCLGGIIVLPDGWDTHPNARYPLLVNHGHFPNDYNAFRTEPPTADMTGLARQRAQANFDFYQEWATGKLPRMLILLVQHANPYYDDSYAVNSANVGPYGDAINKELIPYIEKQFRAIGEPWARVLYG